MSTYRPDPIIDAIARREVDLPFEVRASKPEYYGFDASNNQHEILYNTSQFTMGTLYDPTPGDKIKGEIWPQTTMFKLAILTPDDVLVLGATSGYHRHFPVEGRTPHDQYHQAKGAMINVCNGSEGEAGGAFGGKALLAIPDGLEQVTERDGWWFFRAGETFVAAFPLGGGASWTDLGDSGGPDYRWLQNNDTLGGWVIDTGTTERFADAEAFIDEVLTGGRLDVTRFASDRTVSYRSLDGDTLKIRHTGGPGGRPEAWTNGEALTFRDWPVFKSPYVNEPLDQGTLEINDGREFLSIDFTGEWPTRHRAMPQATNP